MDQSGGRDASQFHSANGKREDGGAARSGPPTLTLTNRRVSGKLPCAVQLFAADASFESNSPMETDVRVTFLAANQCAAHGLALDRVFVEPRVSRDPRYSLSTSGRRPSRLYATRGRSFIRLNKKATTYDYSRTGDIIWQGISRIYL